ncbi:MAG: hypothetical protein D6762_08390 [Candidatus Neomarinimicrobiota bacterium]|nr:MAG: hypothetical protein D6762_08390 [Candidatus Neomarinimicrobiota bacterium]
MPSPEKSHSLPVTLEEAPRLADYFHAGRITLVREDLLPDGGGKKRRSLSPLLERIRPGQRIHVFSYDSSHTAYTLARLFPDQEIMLYGKAFPGGGYRQYLIRVFSGLNNLHLRHGSLVRLACQFQGARRRHPEDYFLSPGGALPRDTAYEAAAREVRSSLDQEACHVVPVASGNLLDALRTQFPRVVGVLTQPTAIRLWMKLQRPAVFYPRISIEARETLVRDVYRKTGYAFDPVFMGSVLAHLLQRSSGESHLCLWVTCPSLVQDYHRTR